MLGMNKMKKPVYVTRPALPPLKDFVNILENIWEGRTLTNGGPWHCKLEEDLCAYLGVEHISLFTNATVALMTALRVLEIKGEVITTPFSFAATTSALVWNGLEPVFADIDPETFNLDPRQVRSAVTSRTAALLPVHTFGRPCDVAGLQNVADDFGLSILYDSAHAFGVNCHCGSLLSHGDLSVLSFHATKVFNTFEGGAIISKSAVLKEKIDQLKNFGFYGEGNVLSSGINGKMSELHAAVGVLQLQQIDFLIEARKRVAERYFVGLANVPGIFTPPRSDAARQNYSYFPVLVGVDYPISREALVELFKQYEVYPRRYFYPLISNFPIYHDIPSASPKSLPVANRVAEQVLCLPIFPDLDVDTQEIIISIIANV